MIESSAFYFEKFSKFSRTLFRKCLYPQLLNISINFIELFLSVHMSFLIPKNVCLRGHSTLDPQKKSYFCEFL